MGIYPGEGDDSGSYGSFILKFLRNLLTAFRSGCINLHSYQQLEEASFSPTTFPTLVVSCLLDDGHSNRHEEMLHLILICVSLMTRDVELELLFMYLLAFCLFPLKKKRCLFSSFDHFALGYLGFCVLLFAVELYKLFIYIWGVNPLSDT